MPGFKGRKKMSAKDRRRESELESTKAVLLKAIEKRNMKQIKKTIDGLQLEVEEKKDFLRTPLLLAVTKSSGLERLELVRMLIEHGADVDSNDYSHLTPLILATREGNLELICLLLDHGAQLEHVTDMEGLPIYFRMGLDYATSERVNKEAAPFRFNSALMEACRYRYIDVVKELLTRGANINLEGKPGKTALHVAAFCYTMERFLGNINNLDHGDKFNIMPACPPVLKILIDHNANVCTVNEFGETPVQSVLDHIGTIMMHKRSTKYVKQSLTFYYVNLCLLLKAGCPVASTYEMDLVGKSFSGIDEKETFRTFALLIGSFSVHGLSGPTGLQVELGYLESAFVKVMTLVLLAGLKPIKEDVELMSKSMPDLALSSPVAGVLTLMEDVLSRNHSLKQLCQIKLRDFIKPPLRTNVMSKDLQLPPILRQCVTFDHYVPTDEHVDLYLKCPDYPGLQMK